MSHLNTNTAAPYVNFLPGANKWDSKILELFATKKKFTKDGLRSKTTSSCNGDLEIEVSGVNGYEITNSSYHERVWE